MIAGNEVDEVGHRQAYVYRERDRDGSLRATALFEYTGTTDSRFLACCSSRPSLHANATGLAQARPPKSTAWAGMVGITKMTAPPAATRRIQRRGGG